jgi:hypothetical protein
MPAFSAAMVSSAIMRSVAMRPGIRVFTRIFSCASSRERLLARLVTPERKTLESRRLPIGSFTEVEVSARIDPPPRARIDGSAARTRRTTLISVNS